MPEVVAVARFASLSSGASQHYAVSGSMSPPLPTKEVRPLLTVLIRLVAIGRGLVVVGGMCPFRSRLYSIIGRVLYVDQIIEPTAKVFTHPIRNHPTIFL
jgi:hypothetical protein